MPTVPPFIIDCNAWGARKATTQKLSNNPTGIVIHHMASANSNDLSFAHAVQLAKNCQADHMDNPKKRWGDTGQHFTVTRGGHVLEGRRGSLACLRGGSGMMVGCHAPARNNDGIGIENEGTYTTATPPFRLWHSLVALCSYICGQYGISSNSIEGHRTYNGTECPGSILFKMLPALRADVATVRTNGFLPPRGRWRIKYIGSNESYDYVFQPDSHTVQWADVLEPFKLRGDGHWSIQDDGWLRIEWTASFDVWNMPMEESSSGSTTYRDGSVDLALAQRTT